MRKQLYPLPTFWPMEQIKRKLDIETALKFRELRKAVDVFVKNRFSSKQYETH